LASVASAALLTGCAPEAQKPAAEGDSAEEEVARAELQFRWPLLSEAAFYQTTGVDHDPEVHEAGLESVLCTNYDGRAFPWCYDEHEGSDYLLDGGFDAMDAGSQPIVAAAAGTVIDLADGNYDRCHADASTQTVSCDGYEQAANFVTIDHGNGWHTRYLHMMKGSVAVEVGQVVNCGEQLGIVGSSGNSSAPHLHFQLEDEAGVVTDPYAGEYSQPETWWVEQGEAEGFPGQACADADVPSLE
jgi:murein DD-endopeptidase MepM/ murein hydrolase activator NlpD